MTIWAELMSATPAGSENVKAKLWFVLVPELGATETGAGPTELAAA